MRRRAGATRTIRTLRALALVVLPLWLAGPVCGGVPEDLRKAESLYRERSYAEAAKLLVDVLRREPALGTAHRLLGHAYFDLGRKVEARRSFMQSIAYGVMTRDVLVRLIRIERAGNRRVTALNLLRIAQQIDPDNEDILLNLAVTAADIGLDDEARAVCEQIVEANPLNVAALVLLGNLRLTAGQKDAAAAAFELAYELGRTTSDLAKTIADLRFQAGAREEAARWYERALETLGDAAPATLRADHAQVLFALRDLEGAERAARKTIESSSDESRPARSRALLLLGQIAGERGDMAMARKHWEQALELGEVSVEVHEFLAAHAFREKDFKGALGHYQKLLAMKSGDGDALYYASRCHLELARVEEAKKRLAEYIGRNGLDTRAAGLVEVIAARQGKAP